MKFCKNNIYTLILILLAALEVNSAERIGNIYINKKNVFDSTQKNWFFLAPALNAVHIITKDYIINDEILFKEDDEIDDNIIYETERNLRSIGIFTDVNLILDSVNDYKYDVIINTQDKWSTYLSFLFGTGGNQQNIGARIEEMNLFGTANQGKFEALYRTENDIGWQGIAGLNLRRLFRSELNVDFSILANKYRTQHAFSLNKPFRTLNTKNSFGINVFNHFGSDFLFKNSDTVKLMPVHEKRIQFWYSQAWRKSDRVFISLFGELEDVNRGRQEYERAYDNCGKIMLAFSSVAEEYYPTSKLNGFQIEDLPVGGWGTGVLGRIFPIGSKGLHLYYVGGQGEKSWLFGNLYLFAQLTGASSFTKSFGFYTYQEFSGLGFYKINDKHLIAGRVRQQTVWNWWEIRQLILDNSSGLRGYNVNQLAGDSRIIGNLEYRFFPDYEFWILKFSSAAFYDFGSVWDQGTKLYKTRWHHSVGAGIRIHNMTASGPNSMFRIDVAYNFDEHKIGEIIFTTDQLFSIFQSHKFKLPELYGREFDYE